MASKAAALWRSHSGRGAEQADWDTTDHTNRIDDLARAHTVEGTPRHTGEAIAAAQRNLTSVTHDHDQHVTTHAARGHLHHLAATLVTLDKAQRTLQQGIWDIAAARRAQHDRAKGPWNGYDEQRATADLTPVLTAGEARIAHLRRRHLDATHQALTTLIPQLTDTPRDGHRHYAMRNHLAPWTCCARTSPHWPRSSTRDAVPAPNSAPAWTPAPTTGRIPPPPTTWPSPRNT
ncbi:hypothetical protein [Streptomyces flaveolus]|uniref:hypothetical protein n=1 Tax=Streptomyces flaveolus TaxID=67297 RepID=UPI0036C6C59E